MCLSFFQPLQIFPRWTRANQVQNRCLHEPWCLVPLPAKDKAAEMCTWTRATPLHLLRETCRQTDYRWGYLKRKESKLSRQCAPGSGGPDRGLRKAEVLEHDTCLLLCTSIPFCLSPNTHLLDINVLLREWQVDSFPCVWSRKLFFVQCLWYVFYLCI